MSELNLAKLIAAGDEIAAERFVLDHYAAIFRTLLRLTNHREEAEDLTQQAFMTARRKIAGYRGGASLRTWLHRIAINEWRQSRRKKRWTGQLLLESARPDSAVEAFETGYVLSQAIAKLSDKLREAFILHEVDQLSMNEVAEILEIPLGTAKARVAAARHRLRSLLEDRLEVVRDEIKSTP